MRETMMFLGQIVRRWRVTGAVAPSGDPLARAMTDAVGEVARGQVILELGPGTGVFSRELVRRFPHARVVAVEVNDVFASHLSAAVPGLTVVNGCASRLDEHLTNLGLSPSDVAAVVSGLPLLSLPGDLPQKILASVAAVLRPGRRYIQFTYFRRAWRRFDTVGFRWLPHRRVWRNIPPAIVLSFTRDE
ncbi:class I SAM-dependent methyltransferase [Fimbriiglobus ruber]|nr:methyltransferase domain-containing protein [Fimbriiglobus ruber]